MKKRSAFEEWFKEQYGGRMPDERKRRKLSGRIRSLESELHYLKADLKVQDWLYQTWNESLKGWCAAASTRTKEKT
mgnify:CR=1 FL=1